MSAATKIAALNARIATLQAKVAELELKGDAGDFVAKVGDEVVYLFGRGENVQEYTGKVLGIRAPAEGEKGGTIAKIISGEGYDAEVRGVFVSKILRLASYAPIQPVALRFWVPDGDEAEPDGDDVVLEALEG